MRRLRRRPSRAQLRRRVRALERHGDTLRARISVLEARVEELETPQTFAGCPVITNERVPDGLLVLVACTGAETMVERYRRLERELAR